MLKRLLNQCTVRLRLETLEPLLVKSGSAVVHGPDMAFVRTNRNGHFEPFLPGSSLKGVLRSHTERIVADFPSKEIVHGSVFGTPPRVPTDARPRIPWGMWPDPQHGGS